MVTIYHNPRCSKSRAALEYLEAKNISCSIVKYLDTPPTVDELTQLLKKLGKRPMDIIRTGEEEFKQYKDKNLIDSEWITVLVANPKLIERPIIVHDNKAVIARPLENIDLVL